MRFAVGRLDRPHAALADKHDRSQPLAAAEASGSVRAPADGEEELLTLQRKWTAAAPLESVQAASECRYGAKCCRKNVPALIVHCPPSVHAQHCISVTSRA